MSDGMYDAADGDFGAKVRDELWKDEENIVEKLEGMVEKAEAFGKFNPDWNSKQANEFISKYNGLIETIKKDHPYFWKERV